MTDSTSSNIDGKPEADVAKLELLGQLYGLLGRLSDALAANQHPAEEDTEVAFALADWWGNRLPLYGPDLSKLAEEQAAEIERLRGESASLTKALTGLTCGGSEFFVRRGGRYVADIDACVEWVRRRDTNAHDRSIKAITEKQEAEARALKAESLLGEAVKALEPFAYVAERGLSRAKTVHVTALSGAWIATVERESFWSARQVLSSIRAALSSTSDRRGGG